MSQADKSSINAVEILVLQNDVSGKGGKFIKRMRVVEWQTNTGNYRMLEKRDFNIDEKGREVTGKAKGFNLKDVEFILANKEAVLQAMQPGYAVPMEAIPPQVEEEASF